MLYPIHRITSPKRLLAATRPTQHLLILRPAHSLPLLRLLLFVLLDGLIRILDRQAPNVQVVADGPDDVDHEATVDADRQTETHEHVRNLIHIASERARPAEADPFLEPGSKGVGDAVDERVDEDVAAREAGLGEVRDDDAADRVRVDETGVEDERYEMLVEDDGLEVEVRGDQGPCGGEGEETEHSDTGAFVAATAGFHDVHSAV